MMTTDGGLDLAAIEDLLRQRLSAAKADGLRVQPGTFNIDVMPNRHGRRLRYSWEPVSDQQPICLIGALLLHQTTTADPDRVDAAARLLGRSWEWVWALIGGYDGTVWSLADPWYQEAAALGRKFRDEWQAEQARMMEIR